MKYALVAFGSNEAEGNAVMAAHNALGRCIKAALGAVGIDVFAIVKRNADRHRLTVLADLLPAEPRARLFAAAPPPHLRQLDTYYRTSRYGRDAQVEWPAIPTETLLASARQACLAMADHALAATGKTPREVGYGEHVGNDALGGFGSLPLDHYARRKLSDRERQQLRREALDAERIDALRTLLGNTLTASQLADVEAQWHKFGAPADAVARIARVMAAPEAWRTLLGGTGRRLSGGQRPPRFRRPVRGRNPPGQEHGARLRFRERLLRPSRARSSRTWTIGRCRIRPGPGDTGPRPGGAVGT